jgi:hypothetical protein
MAGSSGTPLIKKLGLFDGCRLYLKGAPAGYLERLGPGAASVSLMSRPGSATDIAHVFAWRKRELPPILVSLRKKLRPDAVIWVSWPKKASGLDTDLTDNAVREVALPLGLVDIKVSAIDETWSGLKFVVRKTARQPVS